MEFNTQPEPIKNEHPESWNLVIEDFVTNRPATSTLDPLYATALGVLITLTTLNKGVDFNDETQDDIVNDTIELFKARNRFGASKYGTALQPFNGRDSMEDALEEALDLVVYLRTLIYEQDGV